MLTENYVASNAKIKAALGMKEMPVRAKDGLGRLLRALRKSSLLLTGSSLHQMIISGAQASKGSESSLRFWGMTT